MIPFIKNPEKIWSKLPWAVGLALFSLALYESLHLPLWNGGAAALTAFFLGFWSFGRLLKSYRRWKRSEAFPARRLALLSILLVALAYFLEFSETLPGSSFLFVFLVLWILWCLWQRMQGALLATSLGILSMALLIGILRTAALASTVLLFSQNWYEAYQARQAKERLKLHWEKKENGKEVRYRLYRGDAKQALLSLRADASWFLDAKVGSGASPDYPRPGLYLGAFSQSITDPWAAPSLSFYYLELNDSAPSSEKKRALDFEALISRLFAKSYALLKERQRQGSLRELRFLGKVKLHLPQSRSPSIGAKENRQSLKGIAFSFYDLSVEKKLRLGLFPRLLPQANESWVLMTLEEPQIGFPMDPRLLDLLESLSF